METNAYITIKGMQLNQATKDDIEFVTEGCFYCNEDGYYITYNESDVTGMDGTITTIRAKDSVVTLTRRGTVNNQFVFDKSQSQLSYYETPYGTFTMNVISKKVDIDLCEGGGCFNIAYALEVNGSFAGENKLNLLVKTLASNN